MNKEPISNRRYWAKRRKQEEQWIKDNLANDEQFGDQLQRYYDQVIVDINKAIDMNANLITDASGKLTGYKPVSKAQMATYEAEAQKVVAQADAMRANHKHPTYDDFPAEVNRRMRVYNATMRINRLELLKAQIGVDLLPATMQTDQALQDKLSDDYTDECKRQAAIMAVTAQPSMWTGKKVAKVVMAQTNSATFSQRLWANQDALKAKLDQVISTGIVQGQGPREMARRLKAQVKTSVDNQRYVTERIARTESARVQFTAQMDSIKGHGYRFVHWYAEPRACVECAMIAHQDNGFGEGIYETSKVPEIPVHPNCRCSISETWIDDEQNIIK